MITKLLILLELHIATCCAKQTTGR